MSQAISNYTNTAHRNRSAPSGLPVWTGVGIVFAAFVTALLVAYVLGEINWVYSLIFVAGSVCAALFVQVRGLFMVVVTIPMFYGLATLATGWALTQATSSEGSEPFSRATLITSGFPIIEHFIALATATGAAAIIAIVRIVLARRQAKVVENTEHARRRATAVANRKNRETAKIARERSTRLSVAELMARNEQAGRPKPAPRPSNDIHEANTPQGPQRPDPSRRAGKTPEVPDYEDTVHTPERPNYYSPRPAPPRRRTPRNRTRRNNPPQRYYRPVRGRPYGDHPYDER